MMKNELEDLILTLKKLRSPNGCDWDKSQTHKSLIPYLLEETYEVIEAIQENNMELLKEELGDLLLHIVFYSRIASENNDFDISDVLNGISDKLIYRHPHIYGDVKVKDAKEVKKNWEKLKLKEGKKSVLEGVPKSLPAIVKAFRIQEKVRGVGFDWDNKTQVWQKVQEEIEELKHEETENNHDRIESEFGDVLFALVNYSRFIDVNPEDALERTNKRFIKRFKLMEDKIKTDGYELSDMSFDEMDKYWEWAKKKYNII